MKLSKFLIIFLLAPILLIGQDAFAHATPTSYLPEASTIFDSGQFPQRVKIVFTERVEPLASSIVVYSPDGSEINEKAFVDLSDAHVLNADLRQNETEGTFTVSWQVVSADDGHFTKGAFVFSVGKETQIAGAVGPQTQVDIVHLSTTTEGLTIFIELLGQALLVGIFGFFLFMRQYGKTISEKSLNLMVIWGLVLVIAGALLYFFANSASLAEAQKIGFNDSVNKFASTVSGSFSLYRASIALVLFFIFWFSRKGMTTKEKVSFGEIISIIFILTMVYMRARVSHASASHFYPSLSIAVNFVHLLFKELWIGCLIAITLFLPSLRSQPLFDRRIFFINFSKLISIAIGIAGATGFYIIWLHLKDPKFISTTDWGSRFISLSLAAAVFIGLRLFHQFVVEYKNKGERLVKYTFLIETIFGMIVLLFTSFLIITTPPVEQTVFERSTTSQGAMVSILDHNQQHFQIDIKNQDGSPTDIINLVVTIFNDEKGIGPIIVNADKVSDEQYYISQKDLSPSGKWRIEITAQRRSNYDAVASFIIDYPKDIISLAQISDRHFGGFEIVSIIGAVVVLIVSVYLYRLSNKLFRTYALGL